MKNWMTKVGRLQPRVFRLLPHLTTLRFAKDERGNFAMIAALVLVPLLLAGMVAVDTANLMRVRNNVQASLDAAALAVGKRFSTGASQSDMQAYGARVFGANLTAINIDAVQFQVSFPEGAQADQQVRATANFTYKSLFGAIASRLLGSERNDWDDKRYAMQSAVRLKNTVEVALVLDNSGSMDYLGSGSSKKRMDLLKDAAKQLVETMAAQSAIITRVEKPVQFSLVPFAGSVNVGSQYLKCGLDGSSGAQ
jgi:Flp pilus assembly protein TadG